MLRGRYAEGVAPLPDRLPLAAFGGLVDESRRGRMVCGRRRAERSARLRIGARRLRRHPHAGVRDGGPHQGRPLGRRFGVDSATPRAWTDEERELIREVAERTWAAAEQARAEAALRESEARHRRLFETMEEGFAVGELVRDARGEPIDWRFLVVNAALERLSGLRPEDVVGRLGSEVFPDDYRDLGAEILADVVDTQRPRRIERRQRGARPRLVGALLPVRRRSLRVALRRHHAAEAGGGGAADEREAAGLPAPARRRAAAAPRRGRHPVRSGVHAGRAAAGRLRALRRVSTRPTTASTSRANTSVRARAASSAATRMGPTIGSGPCSGEASASSSTTCRRRP